MKRLNELYNCPYDTLIKGIKTNSKEVTPGDLFLCIKGVTVDRHDFIPEAVKNGASAIVVSKDINEDYGVPIIKVEDTNSELAKLSRKFYDDPASKLHVIAVTGTDGKTSVATIVKNLLGDKCGYIGSNGFIYKDNKEDTANTTPDIDKIYEYMDKLVKNDCDTLSMEASSEAFLRNRLPNLKFDVGILTNITGDHILVHKTFENYLECKKELFKNIKPDGCAILNMDDKYYEDVLKACNTKVLTYGTNENSTLRIKDYKLFLDKTEIDVIYDNKEYHIVTNLLGKFNIYNLMAAVLVLINKGEELEDIIPRLTNLPQVEGRVERLDYKQDYTIILDYAHTANGVRSILEFFNKTRNPSSRIITCIGSAGGRDKDKRPIMGKASLDLSDYVIFTMDDPRHEDVNSIIDDLVSISDKTNYERIIDRKEAIYKALDMARPGDIVLILGKGRDSYMAIEDKKIAYSDYEVVKSYFESK